MVPEKPAQFEEYIPMLLVVFLTVKLYICVQKYDNSKMTYFSYQIISTVFGQHSTNENIYISVDYWAGFSVKICSAPHACTLV